MYFKILKKKKIKQSYFLYRVYLKTQNYSFQNHFGFFFAKTYKVDHNYKLFIYFTIKTENKTNSISNKK